MTGWTGRYYEDFAAGEQIDHGWSRSVTENDNHHFTLLTGNSNMTHVNNVVAANTEFGELLVNSTFTLALVSGISVRDISENAYANLGWETVDILGPVFVGDTIFATTEVLSCRESNSHPEAGIVRVRTTGYKQDGSPVMEFVRAVLVYKRGEGPRKAWPRLARKVPA